MESSKRPSAPSRRCSTRAQPENHHPGSPRETTRCAGIPGWDGGADRSRPERRPVNHSPFTTVPWISVASLYRTRRPHWAHAANSSNIYRAGNTRRRVRQRAQSRAQCPRARLRAVRVRIAAAEACGARIRAGRGGGGEGPARCRARPAAHPHDAETRRQHAARALGWPRRGVRARRTRGGLSGAHGIGAALVIDDTMSHRHRRPATHTTHRSAAVANRQGRPPRPPARSSRSSRSARASRRRGSLRRKDAGSPRCRRAGCGSHGHTAAWARDGHDSLRRKPAAQESDHRDSSAQSAARRSRVRSGCQRSRWAGLV